MSTSDGTWRPTKTLRGSETLNEMRADRAEQCVLLNKKLMGEHGRLCEDSVIDLLTDLAHVCDREGWGFDECATAARMFWRAER